VHEHAKRRGRQETPAPLGTRRRATQGSRGSCVPNGGCRRAAAQLAQEHRRREN
jgi:hypothetical protein